MLQRDDILSLFDKSFVFKLIIVFLEIVMNLVFITKSQPICLIFVTFISRLRV